MPLPLRLQEQQGWGTGGAPGGGRGDDLVLRGFRPHHQEMDHTRPTPPLAGGAPIQVKFRDFSIYVSGDSYFKFSFFSLAFSICIERQLHLLSILFHKFGFKHSNQ